MKQLDIKPGDRVLIKQFGQYMTVVSVYTGAWSLKPMLDCRLATMSGAVIKSIYVEDVIKHFPRKPK